MEEIQRKSGADQVQRRGALVQDSRRANPRLAAARRRVARAQTQRQSSQLFDLIMLIALVFFLAVFIGDW